MRRLALLAVAGALLAAPAAAQAPSGAGDVRELASSLREFHPRPFHSVSRARFDAAVQRATTRAPSLSRNELVVELMRIAALIGDRNGHSGIFPGDPQHRTQLHLYPIRLYTFDDGTYVVDAVERDLVGARLVSIAGMPLESVFTLVRPLVPHDNESNRKGYLPHFVLTAEILDGLHVGEGDGPKSFGFARRGTSFERSLTPLPVSQYSRRFVDAGFHYPSVLPRSPKPLYLANGRKPTWVTTLAGGRVAYAGYNTAQVDTFEFSNRIESAARPDKVRAIVIDMRLNGGGDNTKYASLIALLNEPAMKRKKLYVLIGRATFSAAANFVAEVEQYTKATFVGEPTGGGVKFYSDHPQLVSLPFSGLHVIIAAEYTERGTPNDRRLAIAPDVRIPIRSADYFAGRDPALAYVLKRL